MNNLAINDEINNDIELEINAEPVNAGPVGADSIDNISDDELDDVQSNIIPLTTFINDFGSDLLNAVKRQNPPVYDEVPDKLRATIMDNMLRKPFDAQQRVVQAVTRLLVDEDEKAAIINAEMGTGKTMMSIAASAVMHQEGFKRTLVLSPPHLVYKWRREILESVDNAKVWVLNGPDTLAKLIQMREALGIADHNGPEYFIMGRVRMRLGFHWKTVIQKRKVFIRKKVNEMDSSSESFAMTYEYAACHNCGHIQHDEEGDKIPFHAFTTEKRKFCQSCDSPLWTLQRPSKRTKSRADLVIESMCQIPTIGPKTAKQLVQTFGEEMMEQMLADNVYDFINLMDENGNLVFTDRRALRMERSMANLEFGFGQGGYQPTEYIKRYLPDGYFDLMIVDLW